MAIAYPLALPTVAGMDTIDFTALNAVAVDRSPFTFKGQVQVYPGQMWQADVKLPPMEKTKAEVWVAVLLSLRGQLGTFLMGQPGAESGGTATSGTLDGTIGSNTATVAMTGSLVRGDWVQIGTGAGARLHKVLQGQTGAGSLEIWPCLRSTLNNAPFITEGAQGLFRLASNETRWSVNVARTYGIAFAAEEAL